MIKCLEIFLQAFLLLFFGYGIRLQQDHAVSCSNPVSPGFQKLFGKLRGADAAACFYLKPVSYGFFHQSNVLNGSARSEERRVGK